MPNNRRTKIRIRTHEVTIIRLRETKSTGEPPEPANDSDVRAYASHPDEPEHALLTDGDNSELGVERDPLNVEDVSRRS